MGFLGTFEILAIFSLLGGVLGIFLKGKKTPKWLGFILGLGGTLIFLFIISAIFPQIIAFASSIFLGSWLANFIYDKLFNK